MATRFSNQPDGEPLWTEARTLLRCPYTGQELRAEPSRCLQVMFYYREDGHISSSRRLTEEELAWIKAHNYTPKDMSGRMARNKGKRGEREVIKLLQPSVDEVYSYAGLEPPSLQRNTLQSDKGGFDIVGLEWLALEVKYVEKDWSHKWWQQTVRQAGKDQIPVLFFRRNNARWKVHLFTKLEIGDGRKLRVPSTITAESFLLWFKYHLFQRLKKTKEDGLT